MSLFILYQYMRSLTSLIIVYQDFLDSATYWRPYWILMAILKFYNHMNIEIKIVDPENLRSGMFHHFLCQLQTETCKLIEFWPSYWISVTRLNFYGYMVIKIEFLNLENLILDIFNYFLCQLQTEISKFIEFWRPFLILAVILFLLSGQLGLLSKMYSSDLNNHPG